MNFFVNGQESQCFFTTAMACEYFSPTDENGFINFFLKFKELSLVVVVPSSTDSEEPLWTNAANTIVRAWQDAGTRFEYLRLEDEFFEQAKPCLACEAMRSVQVTVVDVTNLAKDARLLQFFEMSKLAYGTFEQARALNQDPNLIIPQKNLFIVSNGEPSSVAPMYREAFHLINYQRNGVPDFNKLYAEMKKIASNFVFELDETWDGGNMTMRQIPDEQEPPILPPVSDSLRKEPDLRLDGLIPIVTDELRDDDFIIILDEEDMNDDYTEDDEAEELQSLASQEDEGEDDIEIALRRMKVLVTEDVVPLQEELKEKFPHLLIYFENREELQKTISEGLLNQAEQLLVEGKYFLAAQEFSRLIEEVSQKNKVHPYLIACIRSCIPNLQPHQTVKLFFSDYAQLVGLQKTLDWKEQNKYYEAIITLRANQAISYSYNEHPFTGRLIPIRLYKQIDKAALDGWYRDLLASQQNAAIFISLVPVSNLDEIIQMKIHYRDMQTEPVYFIELRLPKLEECIGRQTKLVEYIWDEINVLYGGHIEPYTYNKPVYEDGQFFGRGDVIEMLYNYMRSHQDFLLVSRPRSGKSSVLRRIRKISQSQAFNKVSDNFIIAYYEGAALKPNRLYIEVITVITDAIKQHVQLHLLDQGLYNQLKLPDLQSYTHLAQDVLIDRIKQDIRQMAAQILKHKEKIAANSLIVLIDELDTIFSRCLTTPKQQEEFLGLLRTISNESNICVGIVSSGPFLKKMKDVKSSAYGRYTMCLMGLLSEEDTEKLLTTIGNPYLLRYDKASIQAIFNAVGGDPFLTRQLGDAVFRTLRGRGGNVDERIMQNVINEFYENNPSFLKDIYKQFLQVYFGNETVILEAIAESSTNSIEETSLRTTLSLSPTDLQDRLNTLLRLGLINRSSRQLGIRLGLLKRLIQDEVI